MKRFVPYFLLILLVLASTWSLFTPRFFMMHDFTHVARIVEMHTALQEGQFPVRWSANLGYGYGMPLFQFYAPLPYYIGALLYGLGFSGVLVVKLLIIISSIVTIWGAYKLGSEIFNQEAGLVAAASIGLAPYRAVNIFVRGALSEAWGIMALPLILYGIIRICKEKRNGYIFLYFSLLTLLLSHNLTTLLFLPMSVIFGASYLLIQQYSHERRSLQSIIYIVLKLAATYMTALTTASFYLLPAFLEKQFTRVESAILGGYFDYRLHFLYIRQFFQENWQYGGSSWGPHDDISFYLGFAQLAALFVLFFVFVFKQKKLRSFSDFLHTPSNIMILTSGALLAISLLLSTPKSQFIWENLELLAFVQFPWRWLSVAIIFLGLCNAALVTLLPNKQLMWIFTGVFILATSIPAATRYFQPKEYLDTTEGVYYEDPNAIRQRMSGILPDYIPVGIREKEIADVKQVGTLFTCQTSPTDTNSCGFTFEPLIDRGHEKLIRIATGSEKTVSFVIADYPNWEVLVDGIPIETKTDESGFLSVTLPKGEYLLSVFLADTPVRKTADVLSVLGIATASYWYITQRRHVKN